MHQDGVLARIANFGAVQATVVPLLADIAGDVHARLEVGSSPRIPGRGSLKVQEELGAALMDREGNLEESGWSAGCSTEDVSALWKGQNVQRERPLEMPQLDGHQLSSPRRVAVRALSERRFDAYDASFGLAHTLPEACEEAERLLNTIAACAPRAQSRIVKSAGGVARHTAASLSRARALKTDSLRCPSINTARSRESPCRFSPPSFPGLQDMPRRSMFRRASYSPNSPQRTEKDHGTTRFRQLKREVSSSVSEAPKNRKSKPSTKKGKRGGRPVEKQKKCSVPLRALDAGFKAVGLSAAALLRVAELQHSTALQLGQVARGALGENETHV